MAQRVLARLRRGVIVISTVAFAVGLAPAITAAADPVAPPASQPGTAADAKDAWLAASEQAEVLNEQVLEASATVDTSAAAVTSANLAVSDAATAVTAAEQAELAAQTVVDSYDQKLSAFANASFRGARMSQLSSLLTSNSAADFLDSVTALDRVAGDTSAMLQQARDAKTAADLAAADVRQKETEAEAAQQAAVSANTAAITAQTSLASSKTALDAQVAEYQTLYNQLSEKERQAALAAEERRLAAAAAAASAAAASVAAANPAPPNVAVDAASSVATPAAKTVTASVVAPNAAAQAAVEAALSKVGSRYVFGSAGPDTFDCSGLTSWAWAQAGVSIPRTSGGQHGLPSVPMDQLRPGDLVTYYSPVHHVAMYIGNGQIVHASTSSKPVYVTSVNYGGPNASGHRVQ